MQVTAAAFLFTQVSKITLHSLWEWREEPHVFQLRQLHRPWRRADLRVPARLCGRTVRAFVLHFLGEHLFQKLVQKSPEGNSQPSGRSRDGVTVQMQQFLARATLRVWSIAVLDKNHKWMQQGLVQAAP